MIQFSFDVSVIILLELHQPIRSLASGAALANQKLSCWVPLLLEQLWPIRSSASGAALANQKLSCWVPLGTVTGFHTKPPIMPYFSGFHSVLFIIQRSNASHYRKLGKGGHPNLGCRILASKVKMGLASKGVKQNFVGEIQQPKF